MPPYDAGWGRRGARDSYDRDFGRGNGGGGMGGPRRPFGGEGDFRPRTGWGGARPGGQEGRHGPAELEEAGAEWEDELIYGPARYGLGPYHARLRKRARPDAEIKADVEEALFYDTWVDADAITTQVKDGVVTLTGELPDYDEVRYATDDAWDVDGVRGVRTELTVNPRKRKPLDNTGFGAVRPGGAGGVGTA